MCLIGLKSPHWYSWLKLCVAPQGYQAVAEQIRQLIFSRANGVLWIMSWASRVSSSLHFVEWVWFVDHKCLWSDHRPFSRASALFISPCWFLSHIFLHLGVLDTPERLYRRDPGEQGGITDHFNRPLRIGIKRNHGCSGLGGKECARSWTGEESSAAAETETTQKSQKDCLLWGRDHRPEDEREAAPAGQGGCVRRLLNYSYFIKAAVIPGVCLH